MRGWLFLILSTSLLITACGTPKAIAVASPLPSVQATASPTATATLTATPARLTPTATITPLPTIATFTPTLDARMIVTVTPAPAAVCPKVDPALVPDFQIPDSFSCSNKGGTDLECFPSGMENKYLDFLNSGGGPSTLFQLYLASRTFGRNTSFYQDVTGDGIPDLMLYDLRIISRPHIYYCENGRFRMYTFSPEEFLGDSIGISRFEDLNADHIPEILFTSRGCSGSGCYGVAALGWDGRAFQNLSPTIGMRGVQYLHIQDGMDGTKEIVLTGDVHGSCCYDFGVPWRSRIDTYAWDGKSFSLSYERFAPAEYRYQAVQDGDREIMYGNYARAMQLYRNAIFNDKLQWWSSDRRDYVIDQYYLSFGTGICRGPCNLPLPKPDLTEYPRLAAYAYYRIMLLQIVDGHSADASATYAMLQQDYGNNQYGRLYVEMATAFWDAYQSTSKMYDGCAAAIGYAAQHTEILDPLYGGSDQDHEYVPADVCRFR